MKSFACLALAAAAVLASPVPVQSVERQISGDTANEFTDGGCRDVIFIFARGSTETGNMGAIIGPELANGLKGALGNTVVAAQGVDYPAALDTNFLPGGADPNGVTTMTNLLNQAVTQCPSAKIVAGGYSQGAAMTHDAISALSSSAVARITGVTLFGDTQYQQTGGVVGAVPANRVKIYCAAGDLVCNGTLVITAAHLTYGVDASDATTFLTNLIKAA